VITKRQHVQSRPDPYGRVPRKHSGHAGDGWQAHVYGSGRKPEQGYHGPRGEIDQINRSGVLDDGELDPEIKSEKKRKAGKPLAKTGTKSWGISSAMGGPSSTSTEITIPHKSTAFAGSFGLTTKRRGS